jgi:hypothetical protein
MAPEFLNCFSENILTFRTLHHALPAACELAAYCGTEAGVGHGANSEGLQHQKGDGAVYLPSRAPAYDQLPSVLGSWPFFFTARGGRGNAIWFERGRGK